MISADRPWPGASTSTTSWSAARASASGPQQRPVWVNPWTSTSVRPGAPALGVQEHGVDPGRQRCGRMSAPWRRDPKTSRPPSAPPSSTSGRATASSTRSSARVALDAAGARAGRRRPHHRPRPPRRAQRRLPRPRAGGRVGRGGHRPHHERHGRRRAAPGRGGGRPGRRAAARVHRQPAARAPRRRRAAGHRPDPPLRPVGPLVPRAGRGRRGAPPIAGARWPPGPTPRRPAPTPGPCTSTWRSASRWSARRASCRRARPTEGAWVWRPSGGAAAGLRRRPRRRPGRPPRPDRRRGRLRSSASTSCRSRRRSGWPVLASPDRARVGRAR